MRARPRLIGPKAASPRFRALCKSIMLIGLCAVYAGTRRFSFDGSGRRLSGDDCDDDSEPWYYIFAYVAGMMYMFLALAIICDEFFVPALEQIQDCLGVTPDVAGATLMAAGGSAPELFTSFIGTFKKSDVGFSTIVGSAVFNVLFVIGVCAFVAPKPLALTWWPLFRDCTYYVIGLGVLAYFFMGNTPNKINPWEAGVLWAMYFGYVGLMTVNQKLFKFVLRTFMGKTPEQIEEIVRMQDPENHINLVEDSGSGFRAGFLDLLIRADSSNATESAGIAMVENIKGNADQTFSEIDKDGDGKISKHELKTLIKEANGKAPTDEEFEAALAELDTDGDKYINKSEFIAWYTKSQDAMESHLKKEFYEISQNEPFLTKEQFSKLFAKLGFKNKQFSQKDQDEAFNELDGDSDGRITFEEFMEWFLPSSHGKRARKQSITAANALVSVENVKLEATIGGDEETGEKADPAEAEEDDGGIKIKITPAQDDTRLIWPSNSDCGSKIMFLLSAPLIFVFEWTIPDAGQDSCAKLAPLAFLLSIAEIGVASYFMVDWAEKFGKLAGIPTNVMGLTILAGGTSVPDLLTSAIVAQHGQGDMAISSSIGSNIFDILFGLPLPWLSFSLYMKEDVTVGSDGLSISLMLLIGMLVAVVMIIAYSKWVMYKSMGYFMIFLYLIFMTISLLPGVTDWSSIC